MAQNIQPQTRLTQPVAYVPPTARERRAQAVHRLQVGLFGLAAMLLLVGLANIIMDRARLAEDMSVIGDERNAPEPIEKSASDPLADIGVVPVANPSAAAQSKNGN